MEQEKDLFEYESPARSTKAKRYFIVIFCIAIVVIGMVIFYFQKRDVWSMERMAKKVEEASISDLKTQLDKGSISKIWPVGFGDPTAHGMKESWDQ